MPPYDENDPLSILQANGFSKRLGPSVADMNAQQSILTNRLTEAAAPKKVSLQDALLSAIVQITPGLLGAAIGGKQGALAGAKGGLVGGEVYNNQLQQEYEANQKKVVALAQQDSANLSRMQTLADRANEANLDNADKANTIRLKEELRAKRPASGIGKGLSDIARAFEASQSGSVSATPASATTQEQALVEGAPQGEISLADVQARYTPEEWAVVSKNPALIKFTQDAMRKEQSFQKTDQSLTKGSLDIADAERGQEVINRPRDLGFLTVIPDKINKTDLTRIAPMATNYKKIYDSYKGLAEIYNNNFGITRVVSSDTKAKIDKLRENIVNANSAIGALTAPGKSGSTNQTVVRSERATPAIGQALGEIYGSGLFLTTPNMGAQLQAAIDDLKNDAKTDFEGLGYKVPDASQVAVNKNGDKLYLIDGKWRSY